MKKWFIIFIIKFIILTVFYGGIFFVVFLCSDHKTTWQHNFIAVLWLSWGTTLLSSWD